MQEFNKPIYRIYSRKRLRLNILRNNRNTNFRNNRKFNKIHSFNIRKHKKIISIIIIVIVLLLFFNTILRAVTPIFESLAKDAAKSISTEVTNEETSKIMGKYNYDNFFNIEKDANGKIQMISANVLKINQITSDIALNIQNSLRNDNEKNISIAVGSLTGIKLFSGFGPKINIKLNSVGNVETNLRSEFIAQGVNQTIHRVYMDITSTVNILTPFSTLSENITNQVLILENIILGEIPLNYYNFDGIKNSNQALELIN